MLEERPTRSRPRFNVWLPLWVRFREGLKGKESKSKAAELSPEEEETITTNISSGGCYFYISRKPPLGASATMVVDISKRLPRARGGKVLCHGKVLRVSDQEVQGKVGVACTIDSYTFIPAGRI